VGVCRPVPQILILLQTKIFIIHSCFQTKSLGRNYVIKVLRLERKQKSSSNPFRIRLFLFLSYSFGIETINTFIHSRVSLENHTPFQNKMGKIYTRFQSKKAHKLYPMGYGTYLYGLYKGVPPPPPGVKGLENEVVWESEQSEPFIIANCCL